MESGLNWLGGTPPLVWRVDVGAGYSSPVVLDDDLIAFHRVGDQEVVSCLSAESGEAKWEYAWPTAYRCKYLYSSGPYGTPLIDGERIFAAGAEGRLVCLNRSDGTLLWQRSLRGEFGLKEGLFGFGPGLATDSERLYLNAGGTDANAGFIAIDKQSGATRWASTDHAMAYTTPRLTTVHGRRHVLTLTETGLVSLDPETGYERWTFAFHAKAVDAINAVTPLIQDDLVLIVTGPGPGSVCLRIRPDGEYEKHWADRRVLDSQFNSLLHHAGHAFGFTSMRQGGAELRCVEVATGKLRWQFLSKLDRGQALAVDGRIIVLGEQGHLGVIELSSEQLTALSMTDMPMLKAPCYSAPALARGFLYLRDESNLLCLSLRKG